MKICAQCQMPMSERRAKRHAKYCSAECDRLDKMKRFRLYNPIQNPSVSCGTLGTISELRVSVDLLGKGYSVFRALSPSCSCDLVILKGSKLVRVEVTTGAYSITGKLQFPRHDQQNLDVLAIVLANQIIYRGELP